MKDEFPKFVIEREKISHVTFNHKQIQNVGNESSETFKRDVKKLRYIDEHRAIQGCILGALRAHVYTVVEL